jgi:hypothetical protein
MTSTPPSPARRVLAARAARTPRSSARDAPGAASHAPSCGPPAPALAVVPRTRARGTEAWAGRTSRRSGSPSAGVRRRLKTRRQLEKPAKQETRSRTLLTSGPVGSISNAHRTSSPQRPDLRSMAHRARVAANARGKGSSSSRDLANATGSAISVISKMRSGFSIKGTTRRWWRLARTHPAVSTRPASSFSLATSESSRAWCWAGTPRGTRRRPSPGAPCQCRGEAGLSVAEVEPSSFPVRVVGGHHAGDVLLLAWGPHRERQATGAHRAVSPQLRRRQCVQLRAEEMDPEIPVLSLGSPRRRRRTWPPARSRLARSCGAPRRSGSRGPARNGSPAPRSRAHGSV